MPDIPGLSIACLRCKESLYGPVSFCPFCGTQVAVAEVAEIASPLPPPKTPVPPAHNAPRASETQATPAGRGSEPVRNELAILHGRSYTTAAAVVLLALFGASGAYLLLDSKDTPEPVEKPAIEAPSSEQEAVFTALQECLRELKATGYGLYDEKQKRRALDQARKLLDISPSYKGTVDALEAALQQTRQKIRQHFDAYRSKIETLSRGNMDESLSRLRVENRRDEAVIDLLSRHVRAYRLEPEQERDAWLQDIEQVSVHLAM